MTQTLQSTMHAAAIDAFGDPITPHVLPVPRIAPDEILSSRVEIPPESVCRTRFEREGVAKIYGGKPHFDATC